MKKIICFLLLITFIVPSSVVFVSCKRGEDREFRGDLAIKNFTSYSEIMVGKKQPTVKNMSVKNSNVATAKSETNETGKPCLYGKKHNGDYEKIEYDGKSNFEEEYVVSAIQSEGNFLFIKFVKKTESDGQVFNTYNNSPGDVGFLVNKKTGKMFNITKYDINIYSSKAYSFNETQFFTGVLVAFYQTVIHRFRFVGDKLEVKEIVDLSKIPAFGESFRCDRFGNIFSVKNPYIITTGGQIRQIEEQVWFAENQIAYIGNKWFNENGDLVDADFVPSEKIDMQQYKDVFLEDVLIYSENNSYYYRHKNYYNGEKIVKFTFLNDIVFTTELIDMEDCEDGYGIIIKDRIYFLNDLELYYIDIKSGKKTQIVSGYIFSKITQSKQGLILFEAVDENLNEVTGSINYDGEISLQMQESDYEVFYIVAIN